MLNYLRASLHWMHLTFFKSLTLWKGSEKLSRKESLIIFLKAYQFAVVGYSLLLVAVGGVAMLAGYSFNWEKAFVGLGLGLYGGLVVGLVVGLVCGLGVVLVCGLGVGLVGILGVGLFGGLGGELVGWLFLGLFYGLFCGLGVGLIVKLGERLGKRLSGRRVLGLGGVRVIGLVSGLGGGLSGGLVIGLGKGLREMLQFVLAFLLLFLFTYFRLFYLPLHLFQYWHAAYAPDPFRLFRHSPVYWDEVIAIPLPRLKDWLVRLVKLHPERGMAELLFVAEKRPFQRKAALEALLTVVELELQQIGDVSGLANAAMPLKNFPANDKALPKGLDETRRRINTISELAKDYQTRLTLEGQLDVLRRLFDELQAFQSAIAFTPAPVGPTFQPLVRRWNEIIKTKGEETHNRLQFIPLRNPYIVGHPLQRDDEALFVGRRDIIVALERFILNANQRPSLLLYGNRRTGKSSTLKNLPRLLSSQFEPVYMDCQDAKWHESDQAFCFNLAQEIFSVLQQRETVRGIAQPQLEQFEKNAFTRLDQYLDQFEKIIQQRGKRILLSFDEYEALEESIANADISKNVLGKLRNIIQHRERIVVLVSGSHRFDELTGLNWASYLINTRTLELSFLDEAAARELLTQPVPKLQYEGGVVDAIIRITHCQPYLLQAVASELVNYLNDQQRTTATMDDLHVTIEKVLVSAGSYFANMWRAECSDEERAVLGTLAVGEAVNPDAQHVALHHLGQKEMVEQKEGQYQFAVELFRRWILKTQPVKRSS